MSGWVLSVDVGGTKTLVGAVRSDGTVVREGMQETRRGGDDIARVAQFAAAFVASAGRGSAPLAVGAGFPEYVSAEGLLTSAEVLAWRAQPGPLLAAALALPPARCVVESDVRLGALGEAEYGAGRGLSSFLYVSLGTGLSSAFVVDGRVWPGARGEAIALGERLAADDATLESYASGAGIEARYASATGERMRVPELSARAAAGDAVAADVLASGGRALGDAMAEVVGILDPHGVLLGGGLGTAETPLREAALARFAERTARRPGAPTVTIAQCGHRSGLLGGAAAAWHAVGAR